MISAYARAVLNDPQRIARRDQWFARLQNVFDSRPDEFNRTYVFTLGGRTHMPLGGMDEMCAVSPDSLSRAFAEVAGGLPKIGAEAAGRRLAYFRDALAGAEVRDERDGTRVYVPSLAYREPERWVEESLELMAQRAECPDNRFAPDLISYGIYGVHFVDRILGANVYFKDGQWNAAYLKTPVGQLEFPDLEKDETWGLARRAALAFLEADVGVPLFAMPTLASALNILLNLYGQEGLYAMLDDEDAARHDLDVINAVIRAMHRWYREHIPASQLQCVASDGRAQPPGHGQLCGCTTQLISAEMYRDFILPLDDALLGDYPGGGMIHLCGAHTQHIENFRNMKHLRAVQVNDRASWDLEAYLKGLRDDQVIYFVPCPEMPPEKAAALSGGKRLILVAGGDAPRKAELGL